MNFPDGLFSDFWVFGAYLPLAAVWLWCVGTAPWRRLADSAQLHVWLGTIVVLTLFWSMKAGLRPGMSVHLLGTTVFTLMFGRQLAILGLSLVMAAVVFNTSGLTGWAPYAINALVLIVFPVMVAYGILVAVERWLPANFFVFIFVATFFGAAFATAATGFLATLLLFMNGGYSASTLFEEYLVSYVLLGFAEAWLNGAAITLMVVYLPHWVGSFDDRRYLWNKNDRRVE